MLSIYDDRIRKARHFRYHELSPGLLVYCLGMMMGCRLALANSAAECGDVPSVLITLPIDMKKLAVTVSDVDNSRDGQGEITYPKVAPDPSMYWPKVLITPLCPAP